MWGWPADVLDVLPVNDAKDSSDMTLEDNLRFLGAVLDCLKRDHGSFYATIRDLPTSAAGPLLDEYLGIRTNHMIESTTVGSWPARIGRALGIGLFG